jgi:hypothetical protein
MSGSTHGLADPVVVNPLQAQTTALDAAGKVYDLRDKQATEAWGNALQQATDADGNVNYPRAQALASKDPLARQGMLKALGQTSTIQGQQLDQGIARNKAVSNAIVGALDGDDAGLHDRVVGGLRSLVASGGWTQEQATRAALALPSDPTQLRQRLQQIQISLSPPELQQQQISGRLGTQTGPGGQTIGTRQNLRTGAVDAPTQPGAPQGVSPESTLEYQRWLKSPRDYPDPKDPNTTKHGTNETFLRDSGMPDQYIYPGGAPASPGSQASPLGTGRPPPELLNPKKPPAAPAPAASPTATPAPSPAGTGVSGPTPQQTAEAEATKEQGKLGPPLFQKEVNAGAEAQMQLANYGTMLSDLTKFTSGSGAGKTLDWKRAAVTWAPGLAKALNIKPEEVAAQESFDKVAAQVVQAQNPGSDGRMNLNMAATPHSAQSPEGVDFIIRTLQGNADYIRARASLAANYKEKGNYPAFQESVKDLDPRVFQLARMTQPQRDSYWKSLDDTVQSQLGAAIQKAKDLKVLGG